MRRFSGLITQLQKNGRVSELRFLQNAEPPLPNHLENHPVGVTDAFKFSHTINESPSFLPKAKLTLAKLTMTQAMHRLQSAVLHRQYSEAEQLFQALPQLLERQSAFRILIKIYCEQFDFLSARALLFSSESDDGLRKAGDAGVARFVAHLTYSARNARLIDETFQRMLDFHAKNQTKITARLIVTLLNGLLFLGESQLFKEAWNDLSNIQQKQALESQVLRLLINENWSEARELWHEIALDGMICGGKMVWYTALRYFLTESGNPANVAAVLLIMRAENVTITPDFTALLLRHLPKYGPISLDKATSIHPWDKYLATEAEKDSCNSADQWTAQEWLNYARKMGWPLDAQCADQTMFAAWHQRLPPQIFRDIMQPTMPKLTSKKQRKREIFRSFTANLSRHPRRHLKLAMGDTFNPFWHKINRAGDEMSVLSTLRLMHKRGMTIPYDLLVLSFEKVTKLSSSDKVYHSIDYLTAIIKHQGYPLHSAGIDLSVVELHAKLNLYQPMVVQTLVKEYLAQYPLVNNELGQLTRLATTLLNAGEAKAALAVVDGLRESSQKPIGPANHDCASLQVLLMARYKLGEPLLATLQELVSSRIYFDRTFFRKVKHLLSLTGEGFQVLEALAQQNKQLVTQAKQDARNVHNIY